MMKKFFKFIAIIAIVLAIIFCCIRMFTGTNKSLEITDIQELNNPRYKVGVIQGAFSMYVGEKHFPNSNLQYFNEATDAYLALENGKVDMVLQDKMTSIFATNNNQNLAIFPKDYDSINIAVATKKSNNRLIEQVNSFINDFQKSGELEERFSYWLSSEKNKQLPELPEVKSDKPKLRIGTNATIEPYSYIGANKTLMGTEIEFAHRLSIYLNREPEFSILNFSELITGLEAGKLDLVIANLNITKERAEIVLYSDPYIKSTIVPIVRKTSLPESLRNINSIEQLENAKIGILVGSVYDEIAKKYIKNPELIYYNTIPDIFIALNQNKIAAALFDEPLVRDAQAQGQPIGKIMPYLEKSNYAMVFAKNNQKLKNEFDGVIKELYNDGTIKEVDDKWFGKDESKKILPEELGDNRRGVLKISIDATAPPFVYMKNGKFVGYEIDLIDRICKKLGYGVEFQNGAFATIIPSVVSAKTDIACSCITITEERKKSVLFSEPIYHGGVVAAINTQSINENGNSFISTTIKSAKRTFCEENRYKLILDGLGITIIISFFSILIGTILAFIVCMCRRSRNQWISVPAKMYITLIQGTPILVLLMILFYVIFAKVEVNAIFVAIVAFAIDFAAYASEMFRSGIDAVDKGQIEAAGAMGFSKIQTFIKITLPQALKHILPVYRGEVIATIKITSIVGYIAIQDLTKMSDIIRSRTYEAFFPLISTAIIYFALAYVMANLLKIFEYKVNPMHRKRVIKGVTEHE
ncbi:MAG: ABC transporter permease subunit [bacterium]|nr:ABC transporter permease subunit [bacterium]